MEQSGPLASDAAQLGDHSKPSDQTQRRRCRITVHVRRTSYCACTEECHEMRCVYYLRHPPCRCHISYASRRSDAKKYKLSRLTHCNVNVFAPQLGLTSERFQSPLSQLQMHLQL